MPAVSKKQQRFFGAELGRKRAGKKTKTHMTEKEMEEFASTKTKHLPMKAPKKIMKHSELKKKTQKSKTKKKK